MKQIYKVKVERVTADWGRFDGYDEIYVATEDIKNVIEAKKAEIERISLWWVTYGKAADGRPNVEVEKLKIVEV